MARRRDKAEVMALVEQTLDRDPEPGTRIERRHDPLGATGSYGVNEYVADASAAVSALGRKDAVGIPAHKRIAERTCHAPHLLDAEVGHVLRRGERAGEISEQAARTALQALPEMIDYRYPHTGRLAAWDLRGTITFYDALYVALVLVLDVPLLTADVKLSKAPGLSCQMMLIS